MTGSTGAPDGITPGDTGPGDTGPATLGPATGPRHGPGDTGPGDTGPGDTGPGDTGPGDTGPGDTGLKLDVDGAVATVTLNRPERRNAMTPSMWRGLATIGDSSGLRRGNPGLQAGERNAAPPLLSRSSGTVPADKAWFPVRQMRQVVP